MGMDHQRLGPRLLASTCIGLELGLQRRHASLSSSADIVSMTFSVAAVQFPAGVA